MKLKKIIILTLIFILILIIPISTFGITTQDNGKIKVTPVTSKNFEAKWLKGFDISGYITKDDSTKELISTTHHNLGYHIFLNVDGKHGEMNGKYTKGKDEMQEMHYKEVQKDTTQNIDGIDLTVKTKYLNDGEQIQIIYTLKNTTPNDAKISLGTSADIEIDRDDKATLEKLHDGEEVRLLTSKGKTKKKAQFVLYGKNSKGVTNVDNIWIGDWGDYYLMNIFNDNPGTTKIENRDSAITFSWVNREIKAGETKNYSVVMKVGELDTPSIEIPLKNDTKLYYSNAIISGIVQDKDLKDTVTIHYSIDDVKYTLSPIITQGQAKNFKLDLTKLNLSTEAPHILKVWAVDSTNSKSKVEERNFRITYLKNPKIVLTKENWTQNNITFEINDTENEKQYVSKYQYRINEKEWIDCQANTNIIIKESGINKIDAKIIGTKTGDTTDIITEAVKLEDLPKDTNTNKPNNIVAETPNIKKENTSNTATTIEEIPKETNSKKLEKDDTVANIKIPQTGENNDWILLAIIILGFVAIKSYSKLMLL